MQDIINVNYKGQSYEIDLYGQIPAELLETDYRNNKYISIVLIREIARVKNWEIRYINTGIKEMGDGLSHIRADTTIKTGKEESDEYPGRADDIVGTNGLSRSCFPNMAKMQALAVKNALKWKYPFFEADYIDVYDLTERGLYQGADTEKFATAIGLINSAKTKEQLKEIAKQVSELGKDADKETLNKINEVYREKTKKLS